MHKSLLAASLAAVLLAGGAVAADARPVVADLRVEAAGTALDPGTRYVTDSVRIQMDRRPACGGSATTRSLIGPTAMGILASAAPVNRNLRPLGVTDRFEFGLAVCGIGRHVAFGQNAYWSLKVNHRLAEVGGADYRLEPGDEVLWAFVRGRTNSGDELVVDAPARARPGRPFVVTVWAYDFAGRRTPAAGARVGGLTVQTTDANGRATIEVASRQTVRLRATRGSDIASRPVAVCVGSPRRCSARRGARIIGRNVADPIRGTPGPDVVRARGGRDAIDVSRGGADRVDCGRGRDVVVRDRRDRVRRCERVVTRR